jgi:hypothetical protein
MNCGFKIFLVLARDFGRLHVLPFELVTHSPAGDDGHGEAGASEASVFHRGESMA